MVTQIQVLIWTAGGVVAGSLATIATLNRKRINVIAQRLFGVDKDSSTGGEGHLVRVEAKLDDVQYKLDELEGKLTETREVVEKVYDELGETGDEEFDDL